MTAPITCWPPAPTTSRNATFSDPKLLDRAFNLGDVATAQSERDLWLDSFRRFDGGVKGGTIYGATDDLGHKAVDKPVSVHGFHATMLHLLGMNFRELVYERHGPRSV